MEAVTVGVETVAEVGENKLVGKAEESKLAEAVAVSKQVEEVVTVG